MEVRTGHEQGSVSGPGEAGDNLGVPHQDVRPGPEGVGSVEDSTGQLGGSGSAPPSWLGRSEEAVQKDEEAGLVRVTYVHEPKLQVTYTEGEYERLIAIKRQKMSLTSLEEFIDEKFEKHSITEIAEMLGLSVSWAATIARRIGLCKRKPRS